MGMLTPKQQELLKLIHQLGGKPYTDASGAWLPAQDILGPRWMRTKLNRSRFESLLKRDLLEVHEADGFTTSYRLSQRGHEFLKAYGLDKEEE